MAKKLSEFLKEHNVKLEDLVDDEFDLPIPEVRKRLKENQANYTRETQTRAEKEKALKEMEGRYGELEKNAREWQTYGQTLEAQLKEVKGAAAATGTDWQTDPYFAPVAAHLKGEKDRADQALKALAQGLVSIAQRYDEDRKTVSEMLSKMEVRELKRAYKDFDEEKVRDVAKREGIDDWEKAYKHWKADNTDSLIEQARKEAREQTLKELEDRTKTPPPTELGGTPPGPGLSEPKPTYDGAFKAMEAKLREAGLT